MYFNQFVQYSFSDCRLKPGNDILMVDGKSLVGLTHSEAVGVLKTTQQLVQLVVATEVSETGWEMENRGADVVFFPFDPQVSEDQSITSSMASIPEWARNSSFGPPPVFSSSSPQSMSPLSTGFTEGGLEFVSPEFNPSPHKLGTFLGGLPPRVESLEMKGLGQVPKRKLSSREDVKETEFLSFSSELPATKSQRLSHGAGR